MWQIKTVVTDEDAPLPTGDHSEKRRVSFAMEEEMWNGGSDSESEEEELAEGDDASDTTRSAGTNPFELLRGIGPLDELRRMHAWSCSRCVLVFPLL